MGSSHCDCQGTLTHAGQTNLFLPPMLFCRLCRRLFCRLCLCHCLSPTPIDTRIMFSSFCRDLTVSSSIEREKIAISFFLFSLLAFGVPSLLMH